MNPANGEIYWRANDLAKMLRRALVKQSGKPAVIVKVKPETTTSNPLGAVSKDRVIKYRRDDLPNLGEGDAVSFVDDADAVIRDERYKVRQPTSTERTDSPFNAGASDGYFRFALLTQV